MKFKFSCFRKMIVLLVFAGLLTSSFAQGKKNEKPNVLFIAVDDLRTELNCYGASQIKSPNIDRLAQQGVRFTHAYVQQAICMASRASVLSGLRPTTGGIYTGQSISTLMPDVVTINKLFKQNGYNIGAVGKIYHFAEDVKAQFGDDYIKPAKETWTARGYVNPESIKKIELNTEFHRGPAYEAGDVNDTIYEDGINTLNAIRKLEELSKSDKPFFLAVGLKKPHLPYVSPKKYWDMYPESSITMPEIRQMPENSNQYTMRTHGELSSYYGMPNEFKDLSDNLVRTMRRAYFSCISYSDAQIGKLLDQLNKLGLTDNTVIVLWGDHGYKLGDYSQWCKWSNMDIDTHIPFIFSVPNGKKGAVCNTQVEALDIYPTLAELCGLEAPKHLEGKSIVNLIQNPENEQERIVYSVWPHNRDKYDKVVMGYSVKTSRFNYVEWINLSTSEVLEKELYDHQNDPKETRNIINDKKYADDIVFLAQKCAEQKAATDHIHALHPKK